MHLSKPISLAFAVLVSLASPHLLMSCGWLESGRPCGELPTDMEVMASFEELPQVFTFRDARGTLRVESAWKAKSTFASLSWMTSAHALSPCESTHLVEVSGITTLRWTPAGGGEERVLTESAPMSGFLYESSYLNEQGEEEREQNMRLRAQGWTIEVSRDAGQSYRMTYLSWERGDFMVADGKIMGLEPALARAL